MCVLLNKCLSHGIIKGDSLLLLLMSLNDDSQIISLFFYERSKFTFLCVNFFFFPLFEKLFPCPNKNGRNENSSSRREERGFTKFPPSFVGSFFFNGDEHEKICFLEEYLGEIYTLGKHINSASFENIYHPSIGNAANRPPRRSPFLVRQIPFSKEEGDAKTHEK